MKSVDADRCLVHVCVCTNERGNGQPHCARVGGEALFQALKAAVLASGRAGTHWVTRTGCLGFCNDYGPTVAIHRRGGPSEWLSEVTDGDRDALWERITEAEKIRSVTERDDSSAQGSVGTLEASSGSKDPDRTERVP